MSKWWPKANDPAVLAIASRQWRNNMRGGVSHALDDSALISLFVGHLRKEIADCERNGIAAGDHESGDFRRYVHEAQWIVEQVRQGDAPEEEQDREAHIQDTLSALHTFKTCGHDLQSHPDENWPAHWPEALINLETHTAPLLRFIWVEQSGTADSIYGPGEPAFAGFVLCTNQHGTALDEYFRSLKRPTSQAKEQK